MAGGAPGGSARDGGVAGDGWVLPEVEELLASAAVVRLPMRTRFRGLTARCLLYTSDAADDREV